MSADIPVLRRRDQRGITADRFSDIILGSGDRAMGATDDGRQRTVRRPDAIGEFSP